MRQPVAIMMILMGIGIAAIWTRDIVDGEKVDLSAGIRKARDPDDGSLFWPHWLAEYGTALSLVIGGVGLIADTGWSGIAAAGALGALLYTSTTSLGWALATQERRAYAAPMAGGIIVGVVGLVWLIA